LENFKPQEHQIWQDLVHFILRIEEEEKLESNKLIRAAKIIEKALIAYNNS